MRIHTYAHMHIPVCAYMIHDDCMHMSVDVPMDMEKVVDLIVQ